MIPGDFSDGGQTMTKPKPSLNIEDLKTHSMPIRTSRDTKKPSLKQRAAKLVIIRGKNAGKEFPCYSQTTLIGRVRDNHVTIRDVSASRRHARIERREGDFILEDLNSTNGTVLNKKTITREMLHHGDKIQIGETVLQFILEEKG
jgi:hypothetical protein